MSIGPHTPVHASTLLAVLVACAHTQPVATLAAPPHETASTTTATPTPTAVAHGTAPPERVPDAHAPVNVGFLFDPGMGHMRFGLVVLRGGQPDPRVLDSGRYISPCSQETYLRVMEHHPTAPVVIGLACDGRPTAPNDPDALRVIEVVREPEAVLVRVASMQEGHPGPFAIVTSVPVAVNVPVAPASDEQLARARRDIPNW